MDPKTPLTPREAADWRSLSVIALAACAVAIPVIAGRTLGGHLSDDGVFATLWLWNGASAVCAIAAIVRGIKIIRSDRSQKGMAWVGLTLLVPILVLLVLSAAGTFVLWLLFRNWEF